MILFKTSDLEQHQLHKQRFPHIALLLTTIKQRICAIKTFVRFSTRR